MIFVFDNDNNEYDYFEIKDKKLFFIRSTSSNLDGTYLPYEIEYRSEDYNEIKKHILKLISLINKKHINIEFNEFYKQLSIEIIIDNHEPIVIVIEIKYYFLSEFIKNELKYFQSPKYLMRRQKIIVSKNNTIITNGDYLVVDSPEEVKECELKIINFHLLEKENFEITKNMLESLGYKMYTRDTIHPNIDENLDYYFINDEYTVISFNVIDKINDIIQDNIVEFNYNAIMIKEITQTENIILQKLGVINETN